MSSMASEATNIASGHTGETAISKSPVIRITQSESPLDTLVRRASSKKLTKRNPHTSQAQTQHAQQPIVWEPYTAQHNPYPHHHHRTQGSTSSSRDARHALSSSEQHSSLGNANTAQQPHTKPGLYLNLDYTQNHIAPHSNFLHSPLLHSHFQEYRDSMASGLSYYTNSFDAESYIANPASPSPYEGLDPDCYDALDNEPWRGTTEHDAGDSNLGVSLDLAGRATTYPVDIGPDPNPADRTHPTSGVFEPPLKDRTIRASDFVDFYTRRSEDEENDAIPSLPTVIVSSTNDSSSSMVVHGRAPVVKPVMANFSRPMRESGQWREADALAERVTPQLPPDMREQKKAVLERNALRKSGSGTASHTNYKPSPLSKEMTSRSTADSANALSVPTNSHSLITGIQPRNAILANPYNGPSLTGSTLNPNPHHSEDMHRSTSPSSPYSTYSYYEYNGLIPSPVPGQTRMPNGASIPRGQTAVIRQPDRPPNRNLGPPSPLDYLQLGIECHEANRLKESLDYFQRSATEGGGCGVGMLMYGLSLRHGWGCKKNEKLGFKWVQKAAESAVADLEKLRTGQIRIDQSSVQAELVLAIYEVGQCFFHGWGVAKDHKMAVSYYMVAARLGDGDAQGDLAFCLANGKGCKKNKKEAARWYRAAVDQGQSNVGLAWIYKAKYQ